MSRPELTRQQIRELAKTKPAGAFVLMKQLLRREGQLPSDPQSPPEGTVCGGFTDHYSVTPLKAHLEDSPSETPNESTGQQ
jgi:hypothetical protein